MADEYDLPTALRDAAGNAPKGRWPLLEEAADEIVRLRAALDQVAILGEQGVKPDYAEWLTFHDKVAQVARMALGISIEQAISQASMRQPEERAKNDAMRVALDRIADEQNTQEQK